MISQVKSISHDLLNNMLREIKSYKVVGTDSIIFLTYRCTSRCKTCNIWKRNGSKSAEMEWKQWLNILVRLRDYGIKTVELFGGDALLRKDVIFKMIKFCTENGIETFFPTNSILMDRETAKRFVDAGLGTIYFSLDEVGLGSDQIRGVDGSFDKVKSAIEDIIDARKGLENPKIIICSTISNMNYDHFEEIVDFLKDYPISGIYPRILGEFSRQNINASSVNGIYPEPYFVSSEGSSHLLNHDQLDHFRKTVLRLKTEKRYNNVYINFRNVDMAPDSAFISGEHGIKRCLMCASVIIVNPNGEMMPCPFFPDYILGNLNQNDVDEIWGNKMHREFNKLQREKKIRVCDNCNIRTYYPTFSETVNYYKNRINERLAINKRCQEDQV